MAILDDIKKPIADKFVEFKYCFENAFTTDNEILSSVFGHLLQKKGKQMRPIILLLAAELVGKASEKSITSAVSLELLHTASLLHDDVIDETNTRRGQAAVNANWGNKIAILSGDYMLSKSLEYAVSTGDIRILQSFSEIGQNLSSGEILQLANAKSLNQNEENYFNVIKNKTAKLFAICTKVGAISTNASDKTIAKITEFGELLGICFQLKDDLLDYSNSEELGKPTMNDVQDGKITLPLIIALQNAAKNESESILKIIENKEFTNENLSSIRSFVQTNNGVAASIERMKSYKEQARELLHEFPISEARNAMEQLLEYTTIRIL